MMVVGEGFEPSKASAERDLQSAPFGHSGIPPRDVAMMIKGHFNHRKAVIKQLFKINGGGGRIRTFEGSA